MRWSIATLMVVVALCALLLFVRRVIIERAPIYRLIRQLQAGNTQARLQAVWELGRMGPRAAIAEGALTGALNDPDPGVRETAMYALVKIGSKSPSLLRALVAEIENPCDRDDAGDCSSPTGGGPMAALVVIRPPASVIVPMLKKALNSSDRRVSISAYMVLCDAVTWSDRSCELPERWLRPCWTAWPIRSMCA